MSATPPPRPRIRPAQSLLSNSAPYILEPIPSEQGTLQVTWIPELDSHGLFVTSNSDTKAVALLATHHNGYSCHALAKLIAKGDWARAIKQAEYIRQCGGLTTHFELPAPMQPRTEH